jgi:MinD-like ATPase involved in chromosome partitioning or flagellar assembly
MFSVIIICATPARGRLLRSLAMDSGKLEILRHLESFPASYELHRLINGVQPDLFLLDLATGEPAVKCALTIHTHAPAMGIIGLGNCAGLVGCGDDGPFSVILPEGVQESDFREAVARTVHVSKGGTESNLFSFLPSKAGSGASTIVFNTAAAMARQLGRKVLVIDADLRIGIQDLLLNVTPEGSIQRLLGAPGEIDEFRWRESLFQWDGVDFLLSSRALEVQPPVWENYFQLLNFARGRYDAVLVDLPEVVNPATVEFVRRSRLVFTVCTGELLPLKLTGQRCNELRRWGVPGDHIRVILNRWHGKDPSPADAAAMLGHPVAKAFPNDHLKVRDAIMNSRPVAADSQLGRA